MTDDRPSTQQLAAAVNNLTRLRGIYEGNLALIFSHGSPSASLTPRTSSTHDSQSLSTPDGDGTARMAASSSTK